MLRSIKPICYVLLFLFIYFYLFFFFFFLFFFFIFIFFYLFFIFDLFLLPRVFFPHLPSRIQMTRRVIARKLLKFCDKSLGFKKCSYMNPTRKYQIKPGFCTFQSRPNSTHAQIRHYSIDSVACERMGGMYTRIRLVVP